MMQKQIKCPACAHWNIGEHINCEKCNSPLDKNIILKEEREKKFGKPKVEKPTWLENYLIRTEGTKNPFTKLGRFFVLAGWFTYMGILTFIIWFAVGFSG